MAIERGKVLGLYTGYVGRENGLFIFLPIDADLDLRFQENNVSSSSPASLKFVRLLSKDGVFYRRRKDVKDALPEAEGYLFDLDAHELGGGDGDADDDDEHPRYSVDSYEYGK